MAEIQESIIGRRNLAWGIVVGLLVVLFWFMPPIAARQDAVYRSFRPLVAIKAHIQKHFVEEVDDASLVEGAVRGMLHSLDPYSEYINPKEYAVFLEHNKGGYVGIGIWLDLSGDHIIVLTPIEDSPAFEAGILPGDVIVKVAGTPTSELTPTQVQDRLRGPEGSTARFTVYRPAEAREIEFVVERRSVKTSTLRGVQRDDHQQWQYVIDDNSKIGYVRITEFWDSTSQEFDALMQEFVAMGIRGLILDVRFNPGGDLSAVAHVVDRFIDGGVIVSMRNRHEVVSTIQAHDQSTLPDWPVAILINSESASGAEILAGALQDHDRAVIVGQRSFGKGSVQTVLPINDNTSALKLTTAYYYLPSGRCLDRRAHPSLAGDWGVTPNEEVSLDQEELVQLLDSWRSSQLLSNGSHVPIAMDRQLTRALEIVRSALQHDTMPTDREAH